MHLRADPHTLEIQSAEVTDNSAGGAPTLPKLRGQIPFDTTVACISMGGAYATKACLVIMVKRVANALRLRETAGRKQLGL